MVSPDTCRLFSKWRDGIALGAGMLVLKPLDRAMALGAANPAEITGFGMGADAHHPPPPSAAARTLRLALADAKLPPDAIGVINAHGTGTAANDVTESAAIRDVFAANFHNLKVTATKALHGNALGASSALEAVATVLGLQHQCDVPLCLEQRPWAHEADVSNSFAFGVVSTLPETIKS